MQLLIDVLKIMFLVPEGEELLLLILGFLWPIPMVLGFVYAHYKTTGEVSILLISLLPVCFIVMLIALPYSQTAKDYTALKETYGITVNEYIQLEKSSRKTKKEREAEARIKRLEKNIQK